MRATNSLVLARSCFGISRLTLHGTEVTLDGGETKAAAKAHNAIMEVDEKRRMRPIEGGFRISGSSQGVAEIRSLHRFRLRGKQASLAA
jgi:hypothetical protein